MLRGEISFKLNKKDFKNCINKELKIFLGEPFSRRGNEWGYRTEVGDWMVETWIDIGGWEQLRYNHTIRAANSECASLGLLLATDFQKWLGMGQTAWNFLTEEDTPMAAKTLALLCSHFMEAIPDLLSELSLDLPYGEIDS